MSKTVDERIVSMKFDNKHFESNVKTSMSTIDKLKQKLDFKGATKGLESINTAAGKVDMSQMSRGVETVSTKFSSLQVMAVTALANITNSAINAGKQMVKSLTVDQVTSGWNKLDQKTSSVQTIMNATGKSMDEVNKYLEKLMWFSDETSYGFTDMTAGLATMVSAGGDIDKLIPLITGVANATAFAGKGAAEFSRVLQYGVNQAYSLGYMQVQDWKTIEGATVNSKQLQEALISAGEELGKIKKGEVTLQNFRASLKDQWLDKDVMEAGFGAFAEFSDAVHQMVASGEVDTAAEAIAKLENKYGELGVKAFKSAQEAKTFTEAIDATKDAVSSQWMKTFEIIFGGYDEAKKLWTNLANTLWDVFAGPGEERNAWLSEALSFDPWESLMEKINKFTGIDKITKAADELSNLTDKVEYYQDVVSKVWRGNYNNRGDNPDRFDLLAKAGYNPQIVQNLVNLGEHNREKRTKLTTEDIAKAYKDAGVSMEKAAKSTKKLDTALENLSDKQLKQIGFTDEEIRMFRDLQTEAERTNTTVDDLLAKMQKKDGRTLLIESFQNAGNGLLGVFQALKEAWAEVFPPMSAARLYTLIDGINKFSESLRLTDSETGELNENGQKIKRTFKGLFALLDIVTTLTAGPLKIAFKVVKEIFSAFGWDVLDVAANIGDAIVKFRDWIDSLIDFDEKAKSVAETVKGWIEEFKPLEKIADVFDKIKTAISDFADSVKNSEIGQKIWGGLTGGLKDGASKVWETICDVAKRMIEAIKNVLGIHSPSTEFFEIGKNVIAGLLNGLKAGLGAIGKAMGDIGSKMFDAIGGFDWSKLSDIFVNLAKVFPQLKILNVFSGLIGLFKSAGGDTTAGLAKGIGEGASAVWGAIVNVATGLIDAFKNMLGIHSPSTVFFALGGFIIAGLLGAIMGGTTDITDAFATLGTKIVDFFKNLDLGTAIALGSTVGVLLTIKKILDVTKDFASASKGIGKMTSSIGSLVDNFNKKLFPEQNKSKWEKIVDSIQKIANAILKVAIAVGILAAAVIIMSKIEPGRLWGAFGALAAIMALMGGLVTGLMAATKLVSGDTKAIDSMGNLILKIGVAMVLMAYVAKIAGGMDQNALIQGGIAIAAFGGIIVGLMAATKFISSGVMVDKLGRTILKIAFAIGVMILVAKMAGSMAPAKLLQGALAITYFSGIIVGLMAATKLLTGGKSIDKVGGTLFKAAAAIAIMAIVAKIAGSMDRGELIQGALAITYFGGIIVGLMAATKLISGSKNVSSIGATLLAVAGAMLLMVFVAKIAASMDEAELDTGMSAILAFAGIIVGLMAATKLINGSKNVSSIGLSLLAVAGAMAVMVIIAKIAGSMDQNELIQGGLAVTYLAGIIVGLMAATKLIAGGKNVGAIAKTLLSVAVVIGVMAASVALLSLIKPERLAVATIAMSALMGMFAIILKSSKNVTKALPSLIVLTVAIVALAGALFWVGKLPVENALGAAAALSLTLIALVAAFSILGKAGGQWKNVAKSALGLAALVGVMALIGLVLAMMSALKTDNAIANALAVSILMGALTVVAAAMALLGNFTTQIAMGALGLAALVGVMALIGLVLAMMTALGVKDAVTNAMVLGTLMLTLTAVAAALAILGFFFYPIIMGGVALVALVGVMATMALVLAMMTALKIENAEQNANLLMSMLLTLTSICVVLAAVGPMALVGTTAMYALVGLISIVAIMATAIGALMEKFPALQNFLDVGIPVMIQLAGGIGEMIGAFIGGIATQIASTLPAIGLALSEFMTNAMVFITGARMVDSTVLAGVGILAASVIALTAADLLAGIVSFLQGGSSFATLGLELSAFMMNAMPFIVMSRQLDPSIMEGVKSLAQAILILCGANMLETITGWLGGESSLATFGSQLGDLGTGLRTFVDSLGTFTPEQVSTVTCACDAIKALADAAKTLPNEGGWLGAIVGENSLGTFAGYLPDLGTHLKSFVTNLGTFTEEQVTTVDCAGKAIKALAEAAKEIPNDGGLWGAIVGENSLATFGSYLPDLGKNLASFVTNLGTFTEEQVTTVDCAGRAIKALAAAAKDIPNEGGWAAKICGDNSLADFGEKLPDLGEDIKAFVKSLGEFKDISSVDAACNAIRSIAKLGNIDLKKMKNNLDGLGKKLKNFGEKLSGFINKISEIGGDKISSAVTKTEEVIDLAKSAASVNIDSLGKFGKSLKKVATTGVDGFVGAFTDESPKKKVVKAAKALLDKFIEGAEGKQEAVTSAFEKIASAAGDKLTTDKLKKKFKNAGKDLVKGFANGIKNNKKLATDAGSALGKAALDAAKEALDENSPSKEMFKVGDFAGLGFVNGLDRYAAKAFASGTNMGESVYTGLSGAIAKVSDIINNDIDAQPTIRPVLDLSDVRAGANAIGGMFGSRTLSVDSRTASSIAASMSGYQNGGNSDVVSAIRGLRKDISNMPRNTYSVGNVTYDDGSNIASAVESLVRAARIEGRT